MSAGLIADFEIDVAVPCTAWTEACPVAEAFAGHAARLALAGILNSKWLPAGARPVIAIRLTDDNEQRRLNRAYRGKNTPTNVLAFPLANLADPLPPGSPLLLGDVVLAFETVRREAEAQGKPLADHLRHLVVHGVLHLLGFDHDSEAEAAAMEAREIEVLAALGVPDPYRDTI
jgi:probable rRNA maturation factor